MVEETPEDAHFLTLHGRHIYCAVAFTAGKGSSRKLIGSPGSPPSSITPAQPHPPSASPTIEVRRVQIHASSCPGPFLLLFLLLALLVSPRFFFPRRDLRRVRTHRGLPHPTSKTPRERNSRLISTEAANPRAFVFELACVDSRPKAASETRTIYHTLHSRVHLFRYAPADSKG